MWTNLFLLFWLSLIPVLTEWLSEEYRDPLPAAAYGLVRSRPASPIPCSSVR